jgi:hypothetical protein
VQDANADRDAPKLTARSDNYNLFYFDLPVVREAAL